MSVDAYLQKQDKTFDTFRSTFSLGPTSPRRPSPPIRAEVVKIPRSGSNSTSTLQEILASAFEPAEDLKEPVAPIHFAPQMRRLDLAPWEGALEHNSSTIVDPNNFELPDLSNKNNNNKTKRPLGKGLFSKFKRAASLTSTRSVSPVSESSAREMDRPACEDVPPPATTSIKHRVTSLPIPQSTKTSPGSVSTPAAPTIDSLPCERPLGRILESSTTVENTITFRPIDPNIINLRRPNEHQKSTGFVSSFTSSPQLVCDFESKAPNDRMSRIFDNLEF